MISTQRIILLFILMNLLVGIGGTIHNNPTAFNFNKINEEININEELVNEYTDENTKTGGIPSEDTSGEGKSIGNMFKMGLITWEVIIRAIWPFSVYPNYPTVIENIIATLILYFRLLGSVLVGLELYLLFKNRKTS